MLKEQDTERYPVFVHKEKRYYINDPSIMLSFIQDRNDHDIQKRGDRTMKNIRFILLGELILFAAVFILTMLLGNGGLSVAAWFLDLPSLLIIVLVLIPGLLIMGAWKDFVKSFSVGIRKYSLLELKNIINAVAAAQKLTVFAALFAIIISAVQLLGRFEDPSTIGPNLAVCFLSGFYALILEFLLLPLRLNAEKKMNEEADC